MGFNLVFSQEADIEFNLIDCFFGALGKEKKFHKDFHRQMVNIKENPFQFQIRYQDIRIVHLKYFKYSIHFNIVKNNIIILRVLGQYQSY